MKKYTQEEFDALEVVDGIKVCPTGDYSEIRIVGEKCSFDGECIFSAGCSFGERCSFGGGCHFGEWCSFGEHCKFGGGCRFGRGCSFGEGCIFCERCNFSGDCSFGECCGFGKGCRFGEWCSFGECCSFGIWCNFENNRVKKGRYVAVDRIGSASRKAYFFIDENGEMFVRAGCWFSGMDEFKERVEAIHGETIHEKTYLAACDLAELMLKNL